MELLILAHFQEASGIPELCIVKSFKNSRIFFTKNNKGFLFFKQLVYSGTKLYKGSYRDGEKEGLWITWYGNGTKWFEGVYQNGEKEGFWTGWYRNGTKTLRRGLSKRGEKI